MYSRSLLNALVDDLLIGLRVICRYLGIQWFEDDALFADCACKARLKCISSGT